MDRRIQKTRKALQDALIELLKDKPLEQIEIQEITDKANTARVTFYRHYGKKEELLHDVMEEISKTIKNNLIFSNPEEVLGFNHPAPSQALFELLEKDREFYKKIFASSISVLIQQYLRRHIVEQVLFVTKYYPQSAYLPLDFIANHIASSFIGNIMWWLADDVPYSAQYMAETTRRLSMFGIIALIGRDHKLFSE